MKHKFRVTSEGGLLVGHVWAGSFASACHQALAKWGANAFDVRQV